MLLLCREHLGDDHYRYNIQCLIAFDACTGEDLARVTSFVIDDHCLSVGKTLPGPGQIVVKERKGETLHPYDGL